MKLVHWPLMGALLHLVQRGGTGRGRSPPRPLLAVPNVTAHPSTASVYQSPYCCIIVRCCAVLMWALKGWQLLLTADFAVHRPKGATGGQFRYVDGSRSPSFYTASPAESDIETMTGDYGKLCGRPDCGHKYGNRTIFWIHLFTYIRRCCAFVKKVM